MIGQELYADRKVSIEPLFEYLKDMFDIRIVPVKGLQCEIICIDLCVGVSVDSLLQLCSWS